MLRFVGLLVLASVAYAIGRGDAPSVAHASARTGAPGYARMSANDDGLGGDIAAIVRDGVTEVGDVVRSQVAQAIDGSKGDAGLERARQDAPKVAEDVTLAASKVSRRVLGGIVIRACPSLGLSCSPAS